MIKCHVKDYIYSTKKYSIILRDEGSITYYFCFEGLFMDKYLSDKNIEKFFESIGIDPLYAMTLLAIIFFFLFYRKTLFVFNKKKVSGFEKRWKGYLRSQIVVLITLIILCILHFLKAF